MSKKGLEPSRNYPHEPESCASTNSATSTNILLNFQSQLLIGVLLRHIKISVGLDLLRTQFYYKIKKKLTTSLNDFFP